MKFINTFLSSVAGEIAVIFIYIILINNYIGNLVGVIHADGIGYYEYLPSIFIHEDFVRVDKKEADHPELYERIKSLEPYIEYNGFLVDKYTCGTAILELPFFLYTVLTEEPEHNYVDGYQQPYHRNIFHAAIFYLFLGLFFLKKTLKLMDINDLYIFIIQLFAVLSTGLSHYCNYDASYSHVYSFFAVSAFIYLVKSCLSAGIQSNFLLAWMVLGLIALLRPLNILIVFFIPFLANSWEELKSRIAIWLKKYTALLAGVISFLLICSLQIFAWYLQTGSLFLDPYGPEGFRFLHPHLAEVLFSYRKGLFVYSPVLLIAASGIFYWIYRRRYYALFTWLAFFGILSYFISSWETWDYSSSYGMRPYIDFYTVLFIPMAFLLNGSGVLVRWTVVIVAIMTIPLNIIQTYQHKAFILHWNEMDRETYWRVFLKTEDRYKGLLYKHTHNYDSYHKLHEDRIGDLRFSRNSEGIFYRRNVKNIDGIKNVSLIRLSFVNEFSESNNSKFFIVLRDSLDVINAWEYQVYLIHFAEGDFGRWHRGYFNFHFDPSETGKFNTVEIKLLSEGFSNILEDVRVEYLGEEINDF